MSSLTPLLSICCITYNHEKFIREAVDSFLMQKTNFMIEIIIHDDASTDNTAKIINEYAVKYPNIIKTILQNENQFSQKRFSFLSDLFKIAKGKYIALCEGDDYWVDSYKLQKQVDFLEKNPEYSFCFTNSKISNERSDSDIYSECVMIRFLDKSVLDTQDLLKRWFIPTATVLFRNYNDFVLPNWFKYIDNADYPLEILLSLRGKVKYLNYVSSVYRYHDSNISLEISGYRQMISTIFIYQNINILTDFKYSDEIKESIINVLNVYFLSQQPSNEGELQNLKSSLRLSLRNFLHILKSRLYNRLIAPIFYRVTGK
jgi:glycosyltransferase involved in cell wall biosynthesis